MLIRSISKESENFSHPNTYFENQPKIITANLLLTEVIDQKTSTTQLLSQSVPFTNTNYGQKKNFLAVGLTAFLFGYVLMNFPIIPASFFERIGSSKILHSVFAICVFNFLTATFQSFFSTVEEIINEKKSQESEKLKIAVHQLTSENKNSNN